METPRGFLADSHTAVGLCSLSAQPPWGQSSWVGLDTMGEWEVGVPSGVTRLPSVTCVFSLLGSCPPFSVWVPGTW